MHHIKRSIVVLVAIAILGAVVPSMALAGAPRDHNNAENTFTKWRTTAGAAPVIVNMAGVVGGDVGGGTFAGEVLSLSVSGTTKTIDALYHFNGSDHAFTAPVHVVQTGLTNGATAVITGHVSAGWLKGSDVVGKYTQITCEQSPGVFGTCFQGTLDILRGSAPAAFHLDKTCSEDLSEPLGFFCTVEHSDFKWIPAGTEVHYDVGPANNAQTATIEIKNGSTSGVCTWSSDVDAVCVFSAGTGRLTQFHLDVVVTANADQSVWYWDGTYWFGN